MCGKLQVNRITLRVRHIKNSRSTHKQLSYTLSVANPVVQSIISGKAPASARMAAARGMLPLPQVELLELLVHLRAEGDPAISSAAQATLHSQTANDLLSVAKSNEAAPA